MMTGQAKMAAGGGRYFCTAGRGLEPFLAREVQERLGATEVRGGESRSRVPVPSRGGPGRYRQERWPNSLGVPQPGGRGLGCDTV